MINQQDSSEKSYWKHRRSIDHQFFFFFSPEGVPVSLKQEQKTAIEIYEGIAHVG
jgi:hypothetical protein